jgi:hypothetical protein
MSSVKGEAIQRAKRIAKRNIIQKEYPDFLSPSRIYLPIPKNDTTPILIPAIYQNDDRNHTFTEWFVYCSPQKP